MKKYFRKEKLKGFKLEEIENFSEKRGVLILDTEYFQTFLIYLENIQSKNYTRERNERIREYLENNIDEYNDFEYITRIFVLNREKSIERVLAVILKRTIVEEILEESSLEKNKIEGIYPLFMMEVFSEEKNNKQYIEKSSEGFFLFSFEEGELRNFETIEFPQEELEENPEYLKDFIDLSQEVFTYELNIQISFIQKREWRNYNLHYIKDLDFLPEEYREKIEDTKFKKIATLITSILILFITGFSLLLNVYIKNNNECIYTEQGNIHEIMKKIEAQQKEIDILKEKKKKLEAKQVEEKNKELSKALRALLPPKGASIKILKIEYNEDGNLAILGNVGGQNTYYKYQKKLLQKKEFQKVNQDFFKFIDGRYIFRIEVEI